MRDTDMQHVRMGFETEGIEHLEPQTAANLRDFLFRKGDVYVSRKLGISRLALARAAAGLPVRRSVRDVVRAALKEAA